MQSSPRRPMMSYSDKFTQTQQYKPLGPSVYENFQCLKSSSNLDQNTMSSSSTPKAIQRDFLLCPSLDQFINQIANDELSALETLFLSETPKYPTPPAFDFATLLDRSSQNESDSSPFTASPYLTQLPSSDYLQDKGPACHFISSYQTHLSQTTSSGSLEEREGAGHSISSDPTCLTQTLSFGISEEKEQSRLYISSDSTYLTQTPSSGSSEEQGFSCSHTSSHRGMLRRNELHDPIVSFYENKLINSFKYTASQKRHREENDSKDGNMSSMQVPNIPWNIAKKSVAKPHVCKVCNKGFDRLEHWTRHCKSIAHREKLTEKGTPSRNPLIVFRCPICGKGLTRKDNLKTHIKTHMHDENSNHRNAPLSLEVSQEMDLGKLDPRLYKLKSQKGSNKQRRWDDGKVLPKIIGLEKDGLPR